MIHQRGQSPGKQTMKLKTVTVGDKTYAEVLDGKPVFVEDGGQEVAFDAPGTRATITRLNGEAKGHREAKEAVEGKLKAFEGITDPAAALKALETLKSIDEKKLIDAGQVDALKATIAKGYDDKIKNMETAHASALAAVTGERDTVRNQFHTATVASGFSGSKFVAEKLTIPADMAQKAFGSHYKVEDGKIVAQGADGKPIFSKARPGEIATFDEALEILVDQYPYKDNILKGKGGGSGAKGGNGNGGAKTMTRAEYDAMNPIAAAAKFAEGYRITE